MSSRNRVKNKSLDKTFEALQWLVVALILAYAISLFANKLNYQLPFRTYVVQSGSMEPAIMTGDIIFIRADLSYLKNQVVTFRDDEDHIITHRIIDINNVNGETIFTTKGDANPDSDRKEIKTDQIIGKVVLTIPKLGFVVAFAKTRFGSLLFVIVPAVLIIYDEYRDMKKNL